MDFLDYLTEWHKAAADVRACEERCEVDADYFCAMQIAHEKETRQACLRALDRVIAAGWRLSEMTMTKATAVLDDCHRVIGDTRPAMLKADLPKRKKR